MGRGGGCEIQQNLLYGSLAPLRSGGATRRLDAELALLRSRLTSEIRLSRSDLHHIALALKVDAELGTVAQSDFDRILDETVAQLRGLRSSALLDDVWGDSVQRRLDVSLPASDWQIALESVGRSADGDEVDDEVPSRCRKTFDYLSGGREPEELESPWPCDWGECGFSGPVGEMVYYHGSGMTGFLCRSCAAEQIRSDGL